jgi:hypothetical protein
MYIDLVDRDFLGSVCLRGLGEGDGEDTVLHVSLDLVILRN